MKFWKIYILFSLLFAAVDCHLVYLDNVDYATIIIFPNYFILWKNTYFLI